MIEAVFVTVLTVAVTFLATVRWARLGPDRPRDGCCTPRGAPQAPSCSSRDADTSQRAARGRTAPRWAHEPHDYEETA